MGIRPTATEADCEAALKGISALMGSDPAPGTSEGNRNPEVSAQLHTIGYGPGF